MNESSAAALEHIVAQGGEADDILRAAVALLAEEPEVVWAGIAFRDEGVLGLGPATGIADESRRTRTPILFHGALVGELWVDGDLDGADLARAAALVAPYVLIGWDTNGEAWDP